jgi:hypothetical protein
MSKSYNTLTVKKNRIIDLSFFNITKEQTYFLKNYNFIQSFEILLKKKDILIISKGLHFSTNKIFLFLHLYYGSSKLLRLKILTTFKKKFIKSFLPSISKTSLFHLLLKNHTKNILLIKIKNINLNINKPLVLLFYKKLNHFSKILFLRRFNLFIDCLKLSSLLCENVINVKSFLYILSQTFKYLAKNKHSKFLVFCKILFNFILFDKSINSKITKKKIIGVKLILNGKIQGKIRSSSRCIQLGIVPLQTNKAFIDYAKFSVFTLYGTFGLKIWINRLN